MATLVRQLMQDRRARLAAEEADQGAVRDEQDVAGDADEPPDPLEP